MMGFTPKCTTGRSAEIWGSPHTSPSAFLQQPCFIPTVWTRVTVRTPNSMTGHPRGWSSPCPSASTAKSTKPFTYVRQNFTPSARLSIFHLPLPPPPFFFAPSFSLFCPLQPQSQPFRGIDSVSLACFCFFFLVYQSILAGVGGLGGELALLAQRLGGGWTSSGVLCPTSPPCFE